jgi:DNA-directed RNA polymerase subunit RPC12/RpoP
MPETVYDYQVKTVECTKCGAPVTAAIAGGQATCEYCGASMTVAARVREERPVTRIDEEARLAGLAAQARAYKSGTALIREPEGLAQFTKMLSDPAARTAAEEAYRQEWEKTRRRLVSDSDNLDAAEHLFRLAIALANHYTGTGDDPRARATLETALDLLLDSNHRDIVRCRLARAALKLGDVEAGRAWLEDVNPRSVLLEVDTEYRLARAMLDLADKDYSAILKVLGRLPGKIPFAQTDDIILASCMRAHAVAGTGDEQIARKLIGAATPKYGKKKVADTWNALPGPSTPYAAETAAKVTRRLKISGVLSVAVAVSLFVTPFVTPTCMGLVSCGDSGPLPAIKRYLNNCPPARAALGNDITWAVGCHNCKGGGGCSDCHWGGYMPVKGSKARGELSYSIRKKDGKYRLTSAWLKVDGKNVNMSKCPKK